MTHGNPCARRSLSRLKGTSHGQSTQARCVTQMSRPPQLIGLPLLSTPLRLDMKYRLRPSLEIAGCWSANCPLIGVIWPGRKFRFTGVDHAELCAKAPGASVSAPIKIAKAMKEFLILYMFVSPSMLVLICPSARECEHQNNWKRTIGFSVAGSYNSALLSTP